MGGKNEKENDEIIVAVVSTQQALSPFGLSVMV